MPDRVHSQISVNILLSSISSYHPAAQLRNGPGLAVADDLGAAVFGRAGAGALHQHRHIVDDICHVHNRYHLRSTHGLPY